jgi:DNA-binding beta-propeller fold protein YncE
MKSIRHARAWLASIPILVAIGWTGTAIVKHVGDVSRSGTIIPFGEPVRPEGKTVYMSSRPVEVKVLMDGSGFLVLTNNGISIYDLPSLALRQVLSVSEGTSMSGLSQSPNGNFVAVSDCHSNVLIATLRNQNLEWSRKIQLPPPQVHGDPYPCGLAWSPDGRSLFVCASRSNQLIQYSTSDWIAKRTYDVDPAPFAVDVSDPNVAYVTCWSRSPNGSELVADASGTRVPIDARGIAVNGSIDRINLESGQITKINCGRQPSNLVRVPHGMLLPCANDDSLDLISEQGQVALFDLSSIFGKDCAPTWADYSQTSKTLAVTLGRVNQLALLRVDAETPKLERVLDTNWYPACVASAENSWIVACAEGDGSRGAKVGSQRRNVYDFHGSLSLVPFDSRSAKLPKPPGELLPRPGIAAVPVPERSGEPSVFHHVVYILKENRTYDQVLGDMAEGDGSAALCDYPAKVTPNHHKLARDFVLLDNYYCNGILSADGHAWAMEGNATSYFERTFGGWTRSYPYGDDPLSVSHTGFIWDDALAHGKTFRNYGEFDYAGLRPNISWLSVYRNYLSGDLHSTITQNIGVANLRKYTRLGYPGWDLGIPDVLRASIFLNDLAHGNALADLTIVYLPQDHTSGDARGEPTPSSCLADNDLALGRVIDGISHSPYWKDTCIFANEDDPQAGYDHIDGHRSLCIVASPYTLRRRVISRFYNQSSVLRTMEHILGIPPMTRVDAESPLMTACFSDHPDFTPYDSVPNEFPLDKMNEGTDHHLRYDKPDENDDLTLNRILWHSAHPLEPYPERIASQLASRGLAASSGPVSPDPDE